MVQPPWILGIAGGSGAGKTTFARALRKLLLPENCLVLSQDNYYIDQSAHFVEDGGAVNFDDPRALDFSLLEEHLQQLRLGHEVNVPVYDFATHTRSPQHHRAKPAPVVLVDGTLILSEPAAITSFDLRVFIDIEESVRFHRRMHRDTVERGRTQQGVQAQWDNQVKPMHDQFVQPCAQGADYVVGDQGSWDACLQELVRLCPA